MPLLKELFADQQAGLTVYSPDCTQSRLWGHLDHAIHKVTGFHIARRQWIYHDINSILRFYHEPGKDLPAKQDPIEALERYNRIPAERLQYGHLVVMLLMQGPSLLTIWRGDNAIPRLLEVKGETQPALANAGSIRGSFWCDNGVCNLIHSSDNTAEAERELSALNFDRWLDEEICRLPLIDPIPNPQNYVAHSGIFTVCDVVQRVLSVQLNSSMSIRPPPSGDAKETHHLLKEHLSELAINYPFVSLFIEQFLRGDLIAVTEMLQSLPATRWEKFVIQCATVNRELWMNSV